MKKQTAIGIISALLILLFGYTGLSKLLRLKVFSKDMYNQPFPSWLSETITYTLPPLECVIALLLFFDTTRRLALWASGVLMGTFTLYTALVLAHIFSRTPCGCGGVIRNLSWPQHMVFNIAFTALTIFALVMQKKTQPENISRP